MSSEQISEEELERLHELVVSIELQLQNIGTHYPKILGPALLASATFLVEKIYHCSSGVESAGILLAAAQEAGLQNWVDTVEREENQAGQIARVDS